METNQLILVTEDTKDNANYLFTIQQEELGRILFFNFLKKKKHLFIICGIDNLIFTGWVNGILPTYLGH